MGPTVLPVASRALVEACQALGVDVAALLARAGISPRDLADPDARLAAEAADAVWREAYAATGDPLLALHAAERTPFGAFRVLDYLSATGATLGDGLRRVAAFFPIVDPRGSLEVAEGEGSVELTFRGAPGIVLPPPAQEYTLAILLGRARHVASSGVRPSAVRLAFPRPADSREHARVFGIDPAFGAEVAALVLTREAWNLPSASPDPGLFVTLDEHARRLVQGPDGGDVVSRVRVAIAAELPGQAPSIAVVARRLALSRRSLQRRLEEAGTTFATLADAVRRERAEAYLRAPDVSIAEASWLAGFSEQSAFARAFRRWNGVSPTVWRKRRG